MTAKHKEGKRRTVVRSFIDTRKREKKIVVGDAHGFGIERKKPTIVPIDDRNNGLLLNRAWIFKTVGINATKQVFFEVHVVERLVRHEGVFFFVSVFFKS